MDQLLGDAARAVWHWLTAPLRALLVDAFHEALARHGADCEVLRWGPPQDLDLIDTRPGAPPFWLTGVEPQRRPR